MMDSLSLVLGELIILVNGRRHKLPFLHMIFLMKKSISQEIGLLLEEYSLQNLIKEVCTLSLEESILMNSFLLSTLMLQEMISEVDSSGCQ